MSLSLRSTVRLSSGYDMPLLGLGVYQNNDCIPACIAALKHGYRHIDSARMYQNEARVGRAVRESGVPREDVFVTTKIYHPEFGYESTLKAVDNSLQKFKFDYVDLFLIHSPISGKEMRLATYRALLEARNAGKIKTVGVSNYGVKHLEEIREAGLETPAINQIELHPFCQQKPIVAYCKERGIVIQAYCPLVRGSFDNPVLQEVAQKYKKDVAQVLVRWSLQSGFSPLPKSSQPARVVSNADLYDFEISSEDVAKIDALDRGKDGAVSWNPVDAD
ncbi:Aldo/keto reductase [Wolfiporia cocos MD-104 SS10]|uniref:Aldo/keto reductase n=1 Tax=Wolfiporia cocos (strain MD-104) TaxID=742152 RepID=A0A2H3JF06_WOLCO|nr:Aldo/keto reductase [Wolfiporia cocos MD-104 SS10]